jgi:rod shape determining protein RodA
VERRKKNVFVDVDWLIIALYAFLVLFGWINIYAASYNEDFPGIFSFSQNYGKQFLWIVFSLILGLIILLIDIRLIRLSSYYIYGSTVLMLILVLMVGKEIKGATSWFVLGGMSLQPSELAKFGTILAVARYMSSLEFKMDELKYRIRAFGLVGIPAILIVLQPDPGSALIFLAFLFVFYREGMSGKILIAGIVAASLFIGTLYMKTLELNLGSRIGSITGEYLLISLLALGFLLAFFYLRKRYQRVGIVILTSFAAFSIFILSVNFVFDEVFKERHRNRINELLGIISDPKGTGYNQHQSKIAIGSGGFYGKGFLNGTQTKYEFVPEQSTDFIYCTVGEEWGFLGSTLVISAFVLLISRIIIVAERQRSRFTRVVGYSVASIFGLHFIVNIAMTLGLAPVVGIPLPFFSYGGSSLWAFTLMLVAFVKLDSDRKSML